MELHHWQPKTQAAARERHHMGSNGRRPGKGSIDLGQSFPLMLVEPAEAATEELATHLMGRVLGELVVGGGDRKGVNRSSRADAKALPKKPLPERLRNMLE